MQNLLLIFRFRPDHSSETKDYSFWSIHGWIFTKTPFCSGGAAIDESAIPFMCKISSVPMICRNCGFPFMVIGVLDTDVSLKHSVVWEKSRKKLAFLIRLIIRLPFLSSTPGHIFSLTCQILKSLPRKDAEHL